jgi:hypothetical protein
VKRPHILHFRIAIAMCGNPSAQDRVKADGENCSVSREGRIGKRENRARLVHGVFLWQPPGMTETGPDEDLETTIAFALSQFGYDPPRKRNPAQRALYFPAAARAVRRQLQFSWVLTRKPPQQVARDEWKPRDKTPEEP